MTIRQMGTAKGARKTQSHVARERLLAKRTELIGRVAATSGSLEALDKIADEDQARVLHDQFVAVRLGRLAYQQLKLIDAALARLDAGSYGICEDCESPISPKRLAAIPWADRCIVCQERAAVHPEREILSRSAA